MIRHVIALAALTLIIPAQAQDVDPLAGYSMVELRHAAGLIAGHTSCIRYRKSDEDHCDLALADIPNRRQRYSNYEPVSMRAAIMENIRDDEAMLRAEQRENSTKWDSVDVQIEKLHARNRRLPEIFGIIKSLHGGNLR